MASPVDREWYARQMGLVGDSRAEVERVCPHYVREVPKGVAENVAWRKGLRAEAVESRRAELRRMCAEDVLFYLNAFVHLYEPRQPDAPIVPFVTYPFQDWVVVELLRSLREGYPLRVEKSRDQGLTYLCLAVFEWLWHFQPHQSFLIASRKEDLVDSTDNLDALLPKIDFMHQYMPRWLMPRGYPGKGRRNRSHMHMLNPETGSLIDGESTNSDLGRAGRRTAVFLDEFAAVGRRGGLMLKATLNVSNCRWFVSTPQGQAGAFSQLRDSGVKSLSVHWSMNPVHAVDLEWDEHGRPTSAYYRKKCAESPSKRDVAQEMDLDEEASEVTFFGLPMLERVRRMDVREPYHRGRIQAEAYTGRNPRWIEEPDGELLLWCHPGSDGQPPAGEYGIGADVAAGNRTRDERGYSNSALAVGLFHTREKVAELAVAGLQPHEFARVAASVGWWFYGAQLIWEVNGPGSMFGTALRDLGYENLYLRMTRWGSLDERMIPVPGWHSNRETKRDLLGNYRKALDEGHFINRSLEALRECGWYRMLGDGGVIHSSAAMTDDPSGARENHGDRVIADALLNELFRQQIGLCVMDKITGQGKVDPQNPPAGSLAWVRQQRMGRPKLRTWSA